VTVRAPLLPFEGWLPEEALLKAPLLPLRAPTPPLLVVLMPRCAKIAAAAAERAGAVEGAAAGGRASAEPVLLGMGCKEASEEGASGRCPPPLPRLNGEVGSAPPPEV
jgi:hypothetical protein